MLLGSKHAIFRWALAPYVCPACSDKVRPVGSPLCSQCGVMFQSREGDDHSCGECLDKPKRFRKARAFGVYDQALMEAVHRFKYKGKLQLARPLGTLLLAALLTDWDDDPPDLVVPVPLHARRFRERGFNQAFMLIRDWPRIAAALPVQLPNIAIDREVLVRNRWTEPQTGLGRSTRLQNIKKHSVSGTKPGFFRKRSCWWMMCIPPAPPWTNAPGPCSRPGPSGWMY
jgi:predicted amidophosphoribosyltransferase